MVEVEDEVLDMEVEDVEVDEVEEEVDEVLVEDVEVEVVEASSTPIWPTLTLYILPTTPADALGRFTWLIAKI